MTAILDGPGRPIGAGDPVFTLNFGGGNFASGAEALASLDSNGDGIINANDEAFAKLLIWQPKAMSALSKTARMQRSGSTQTVVANYQTAVLLEDFGYNSATSEAVRALFEDSSGNKHSDTL